MKTVKQWFEEVEDPRVMWFLLERMDCSKSGATVFWDDNQEKVTYTANEKSANSLRQAIEIGLIPKSDIEKQVIADAITAPDPIAYLRSYLNTRESAPQPYYGQKNSPHEVHKFISAHNLNFNRGCVVKYAVRAGRKDPKAEIKDLEKAIDYLKFEIERLKEIS